MTGIDLVIAPISFPSQTASDAVKESEDYGLRIGKQYNTSGSAEMALRVDITING